MDSKFNAKDAAAIAQLVTATAGAVVTVIETVTVVKRRLKNKRLKPMRKIGFSID